MNIWHEGYYYTMHPGYGPVSYYGPGNSTVETAYPTVLKLYKKKRNKKLVIFHEVDNFVEIIVSKVEPLGP
jgi:hypothetical protein